MADMRSALSSVALNLKNTMCFTMAYFLCEITKVFQGFVDWRE